jgi:hypothetical protein
MLKMLNFRHSNFEYYLQLYEIYIKNTIELFNNAVPLGNFGGLGGHPHINAPIN